MWAAGCQFCNLSCRPSFYPRSFGLLTPFRSPQMPILSAIIFVLATMHKPRARALDDRPGPGGPLQPPSEAQLQVVGWF